MTTLFIPILLSIAFFGVACYLTAQASGHVVSPGLFLFGGAAVASLVVWAVYGFVRWLV